MRKAVSRSRMKRSMYQLVDQLLVGIDIDREVEEIRDERHDLAVLRQFARLQHVDAFEDQDVRPVDGDELAGHDVIGQVRIDRRADIGAAPDLIADRKRSSAPTS